MLVGEVRLGLVVLDILLHLTFSLCCDVDKLNHGVVCLELDDALDWVIQANKKTCHCLLHSFINVGANQIELHFLEVLFHGLCPLTKRLKVVGEVTHVMRGDKAGSHMSLHVMPSCD